MYQISIYGEAGVKTCMEMVISTATYQMYTTHKASAKCITCSISHSHAMTNGYYCPCFTEEKTEAQGY